MSKDQWNARYVSEEYIYGIEPNAYLKEILPKHKPGKILFPAEGEGRNAVFAAGLGWQVEAFDQSEEGRRKAFQLAKEKGVIIQYHLASLEVWEPVPEAFDCVCLVFVHLVPGLRELVHQKVISALKPGGILIFEAFTKNQMPRTSGGPKNFDLLFNPEDIKSDFSIMEIIDFHETQVILDEGPLHQGLADVVRFTAKKPVS